MQSLDGFIRLVESETQGMAYQEALAGILKGVHINRLIEPSEIADIIMFAAQNEAVDATCLEITGGLISNGLAK